MSISGTPFVFVGSTDGRLRAYTMSEDDGSLTQKAEQQLSGLRFFAVSPHRSSEGNVELFVSQTNAVAQVFFDPKSGSFTPGSTCPTRGGGTHIASGDLLLLAHYGDHLVSSFSRPRESFEREVTVSPGQNPHQIRFRDRYAYVPCLGSDYIAQYVLCTSLEKNVTLLEQAKVPTVPAAGGPRHMDFHPSANVAYVLSENSSEVHVFDIDGEGCLAFRPGESTFTHPDGRYHWSSDIKVHPSGDFLYAVNRDPSEIVVMSIASNRAVSRVASYPLSGEVRSFGMDPKGAYLQVGSKDGVLQTFLIDPSSGVLTGGPRLSGLGPIHHTEIHYL